MMSTERLKILHRKEQNQRKFVCVVNDVAKTQQDLYEGYIDKEKHESAQRSDKAIVVTKRNIVRQKVLKKCMKSKRDEVEKQNAKKIYGQYHGVPVEQIASQIDTYLERHHPKIRRKQKIEELFHEGYSKGAILDNDTIHNKVQDYFDRPLLHVQHTESPDVKNEKKIENSKFPVLSKSFYTGNFKTPNHPPMKETETIDYGIETKEHSEEKLFVKRKVSKFLNDDVPDDVSVQSETPVNNLITHSRGIRPVTLPPIKIGTDSEVPHRKSKQKPDCIAELIARIHKAKDTREKDMKIKKERREKRLQHERVFGIGSSVTDGSDDNVDNNSVGIFSDWEDNPWRKEKKNLTNEKTKEKEIRMKGKGLKLPPLNVTKK